MKTRFHKMHGLGNDFVVIDARDVAVAMTAARAHAIADRRTGIGCDQLILLEPSQVADVKMRIFNADGGEVEACGNATRCIATLLDGPATIETLGGILHTTPGEFGATVTLMPPAFDWELIPLAMPMDTRDMPVNWDELERPAAVNVGNPHVIFFVPDCDAVDLESLGPIIEHDPLFPYAWTDKMGETFSNLDLAMFAGVGHFPHRENPDRAASEIAGFFTRIGWS